MSNTLLEIVNSTVWRSIRIDCKSEHDPNVGNVVEEVIAFAICHNVAINYCPGATPAYSRAECKWASCVYRSLRLKAQ